MCSYKISKNIEKKKIFRGKKNTTVNKKKTKKGKQITL